MFNLEQAILDWRRQMAASGIKAPDVLDELESHLRDDVEAHVRKLGVVLGHNHSRSRGSKWPGLNFPTADTCRPSRD